MLALKNILAATDLSECSAGAVQEAFALGERFGARVHLVHVVTEPLHDTWVGYLPGDDFLNVLNSLKDRARNELRALASKYGRRESSGELVALYGAPIDEILAYAEENNIDLIVCGTHGRRGLERKIVGSVAERLVQTAPCPVLTVSATIVETAA